MTKKQHSQGFTVIEAALIFVILAIIGFTSWYVLDVKKNNDTVLNTASKSTAVMADAKANKDALTLPKWGVQFRLGKTEYDFSARYEASDGRYVITSKKLSKLCKENFATVATVERLPLTYKEKNGGPDTYLEKGQTIGEVYDQEYGTSDKTHAWKKIGRYVYFVNGPRQDCFGANDKDGTINEVVSSEYQKTAAAFTPFTKQLEPIK